MIATERLRELLACPACHAGLEFQGGDARCARCGTTRPLTPSSTSRRAPPESVTITGSPMAMASMTAVGVPSLCPGRSTDGSTNRSEACR